MANSFAHAVNKARRLNIEVTLGKGKEWDGSGGPWVKPEQSMQHLVSSSVTVTSGTNKKSSLPLPSLKKPFLGEGSLTPELKKIRNDFYENVAVLAYPTSLQKQSINDVDEKVLCYSYL